MHKNITRTILAGVGSLMVFTTPALAADWSGTVARLVASRQSYPTAAQMRGDEGTAKIRVFVAPDGKVQKTELVTGSGSALLDKEALALPAKIGKFPAPDAGQTSIVLPMTWKLQ